tara:strand:+ start:399 stop:578 length:180 start_codon:yes stop_codon:yes gene_type:complete
MRNFVEKITQHEKEIPSWPAIDFGDNTYNYKYLIHLAKRISLAFAQSTSPYVGILELDH